jgi:hypothetical protein
VRKLIHPPAIAFKGTGFYVNDYKSGGASADSAKEESKPAAQTTPEKPASTEPKAASEPSQAGNE